MNISYPLGVSSQEASVARARVQLNQVQAQLKQIELQVATDVTNAAITVQSDVERVQAAQAARELAQKTLEAEQSKFEVGMSTNYNVIQTQRDLATAQNNELQAILNYRKALVELERLQQTTLQNLNITVLTRGGSATRRATIDVNARRSDHEASTHRPVDRRGHRRRRRGATTSGAAGPRSRSTPRRSRAATSSTRSARPGTLQAVTTVQVGSQVSGNIS